MRRGRQRQWRRTLEEGESPDPALQLEDVEVDVLGEAEDHADDLRDGLGGVPAEQRPSAQLPEVAVLHARRAQARVGRPDGRRGDGLGRLHRALCNPVAVICRGFLVGKSCY